MRFLSKHLEKSPVHARVIPFFIFVGITALQGSFGEASRFWVYGVKTFAGAWLVYEMWPYTKEVRWAFSWEAVAVGVLVVLIWVGLDPWYGKMSKLPDKLWNPHEEFGQNSVAAWSVIIIRILGSAIVVPPLEEVFYRSFLYRYIAKPDFMSMPLNRFLPVPFLAAAAMFGFAHNEWLAGILCGAAYQWLVLRKGRLGDAMTAHAITNFLLGIWVVGRGAWQFW